MEMLAAILGVVGTACIGWIVYIYRNTITYDLISMTHSFILNDEEIVGSSDWKSTKITYERLALKNRGLKNIVNAKIFLERTPKLFAFKVDSSSTLHEDTIKWKSTENTLEIELEYFPRGEEIVLETAYAGRAGSRYRDLKGIGSGFKTKKLSHFKSRRLGMLLFVIVAFFNAGIIWIGTIVK